ncbi:B-box zinc finger protein 24-like [Amaranthus tricolor]|uniref:B-box zinc finger protein 24-like n=1 Tax=Amaranthus tricolor TaxID=29722 RepID=UPI00258BC9DB|nr:B-box zinc finger protein 24-like [Amaranthus tricolor]
MKIQCDVCERNQATVICCADEAALCAKCDIEVHAANKLASKHQRLQLNCLSTKLPTCDICQEKAAFIFCVEDRALFCQHCDESIHSVSTLAANHQRYLATGIRVALGCLSQCRNETEKNCKEPSNQNTQQVSLKPTVQQPPNFSPTSWAVDDLLEFSEFDSSSKKGQLELGEFDWWSDMNLFGEQIGHEALTVAEVPQLPISLPTNHTIQYRPTKNSMPNKKPRIEFPRYDDDEYSIVPDLG